MEQQTAQLFSNLSNIPNGKKHAFNNYTHDVLS